MQPFRDQGSSCCIRLAAVGAKICGRWRRTMTKKIMKRPSAADNKIKRPAAAARRPAASGRGDTIEAVDWTSTSDAETLIMGPGGVVMKKPSAAVGAEASADAAVGAETTEVGEPELTHVYTPEQTHRRDSLE